MNPWDSTYDQRKFHCIVIFSDVYVTEVRLSSMRDVTGIIERHVWDMGEWVCGWVWVGVYPCECNTNLRLKGRGGGLKGVSMTAVVS